MKRFICLTKLLLGGGLNQKTGFQVVADNKKTVKYMVGAVTLIVMAACGYAGYWLFSVFSAINMQALFPTVICAASAGITIIVSIPATISSFYLSGDIEGLLSLPFKAYQIVGAKFLALISKYYLFVIAVVLPLLCGFGAAQGAGAIYWVISILGCIFLPIGPVSAVAMVVILLMRFLKFIRNKDALTFVSMAFSAILFVAGDLMVMQAADSGSSALSALSQSSGTFEQINMFMVQFHFLEQALINVSLTDLLVYILINLGLLALFAAVSQLFYLRGAVGMTEATANRVQLTSVQLAKKTTVHKVKASYEKIEMKKLIRNPVYLLNMIIRAAVVPIAFYAIIISVPIIVLMQVPQEALSEMKAAMNSDMLVGVIASAVAIITFLASMSSNVAATSISREGSSFWLMKSMPVAFSVQLGAKINVAIKIQLLVTLPFNIILNGILLFLGANFWALPLSLVINIGLIYVFGYIQAESELRGGPSLNWNSEIDMVKSGTNMFQIFIKSIIIFAVVIVAPILLCVYLHVSVFAASIISVCLILLTAFVLHRRVFSQSELVLSHIEG